MQICSPFKCSVAKYLLNFYFRHYVDEAVLKDLMIRYFCSVRLYTFG